MINSVWNWIKGLSFKEFIILILIIIIAIMAIKISYYNREIKATIIRYDDSLYNYKNKLKEEYKLKNIYIENIANLKESNKTLYDEAMKLKENPLIITKTITITKIDSVDLSTDIEKNDTTIKFNWNYKNVFNKDNSISLNGTTNYNIHSENATSNLYNLTIQSDLFLDVVEKDKKQLQIIAKSNNPYVNFTTIEGAIISPEKIQSINNKNSKNWGVGPAIGAGIVASDKGVDWGIFIGISVQYTPNWLRF